MPSALETYGPISPPFDFNHTNVSQFSPEVTGRLLLKSMCARLGWPSTSGKRVLDFGCGVRLARTIFNLEIDIGLYVGVDTNNAPIAWLKENLSDPRFRFEHLDMHNALYNPDGRTFGPNALRDMDLGTFDAACMFSVITHQEPDDAELIFSMLRPCAARLYFTALIDDSVDGYVEKDPERPLLLSAYSTARIIQLLSRTGWRVDNMFPVSLHLFQQAAFVATAQ